MDPHRPADVGGPAACRARTIGRASSPRRGSIRPGAYLDQHHSLLHPYRGSLGAAVQQGAVMITTARTITAAGAASLALLGGAALTGSTASAGDDDAQRMPARPAERTLVSSCGGGPLVGMSSRAMDFQSVTAGATVDVEGSQWQVKGPKNGTDTVLVTLTAMASSGGAGELTSSLVLQGRRRHQRGPEVLHVQRRPRPVVGAVLHQDRQGPAHPQPEAHRRRWRCGDAVLPDRHVPAIRLTAHPSTDHAGRTRVRGSVLAMVAP